MNADQNNRQSALVSELKDNARTYLIAILLGLSVGLVVSGFIWGVVSLKNFVWHHAGWNYHGYTVLIICTLGGLIVGVFNQLARAKETQAHDLDEVLGEVELIEEVPLPKVSQVFRRIALGITSLGFGGPLGPEAPIIEISTQLSARLSGVLKIAKSKAVNISVAGSLGALFGAPIAIASNELEVPQTNIPDQQSNSRTQRLRNLGPEIVAAVAAFLIFKKLLPGDGFAPFTSEANSSDSIFGIGILLVIVAAILATAVALLVQRALVMIRHLVVTYVPGGALVAGLVSGAVLGVGGMTNHLVLFSGHHEIQELLDNPHKRSFLIAVMLLKIVVLIACLAGGWFGGQIFPMSFIGVCIALACDSLFGYSNTLAFAGVGFVSAVTVALRKPILSIVLGFLFFPASTWLALLIGTGVALAVVRQQSESVRH